MFGWFVALPAQCCEALVIWDWLALLTRSPFKWAVFLLFPCLSELQMSLLVSNDGPSSLALFKMIMHYQRCRNDALNINYFKSFMYNISCKIHMIQSGATVMEGNLHSSSTSFGRDSSKCSSESLVHINLTTSRCCCRFLVCSSMMQIPCFHHVPTMFPLCSCRWKNLVWGLIPGLSSLETMLNWR